jgi:hypothetical protein
MKKYSLSFFLFLGSVMIYSYAEETLIENNTHDQDQEKTVLISEIKSFEDSIKNMKSKETNFKQDIDLAQKTLDDKNSEIKSQELELLRITKESQSLRYAKEKKEHEEMMADLERKLESINAQIKEKNEKGILICNKIKEMQLISKTNKEDLNLMNGDQSYNTQNNYFDHNTF